MFREKFVAKVPDSVIENANFLVRPWQRTFNVACWVRFHMPRPNKIALLLHYTDEEGRKTVEVDHCQTELESTVLLSARRTIGGKGKVKEMSLYLQVSDNTAPYVIDELYIQSCEQGAAAQPKIINAS